ncbi:MAG TPA: chemotaxis protein CheW [Skermanella sp.]|jgi:purine-binding chemotaxis protein CheW|nr:chemotaxis protein CheW [Skermanella sp.]
MSDAAELVREDADTHAGAPTGGAGEARQYVIFHVADEMFAVPLSEVQEIIRMPPLVHVPLSPSALEGLANLRGTVLPVIRLRQIFGMDGVEHDDSTRVVILDQGRPVGLVVDRMANVVTVEADRIEDSCSIQGTVDTDLMTGMIKASDGKPMVMILDAGKVVAREFTSMGKSLDRALAGAHAAAVEERRDSADEASDESQLVSFEVAGQEYALPIEQVQEIVQIPEQITAVPNTASHVMGVMTLRNRLLPLVSLREMFGLPRQEVTDTNKIVVVSLGEGDSAMSVGVMMDSVKEVLRVGRSVIDAMPPLLARNGDLGEIQSICRLQEGKRLVSILSADRMFDTGDIRPIAQGATGGLADMAQEGAGRNGVIDDEEQFVVFRLMNEEYGVPIDAVQEIVRVPEELTRVPKTADFIEGVVNLRGVVLPVVDQRRRFGLPSMERNDRQRIMVYTIRGVRTGFIVDSVSEVMRISASVIGASPTLSEEQQRLIRRVANIERHNRMILLLDVDQLLDVKELDAVGTTASH